MPPTHEREPTTPRRMSHHTISRCPNMPWPPPCSRDSAAARLREMVLRARMISVKGMLGPSALTSAPDTLKLRLLTSTHSRPEFQNHLA